MHPIIRVPLLDETVLENMYCSRLDHDDRRAGRRRPRALALALAAGGEMGCPLDLTAGAGLCAATW